MFGMDTHAIDLTIQTFEKKKRAVSIFLTLTLIPLFLIYLRFSNPLIVLGFITLGIILFKVTFSVQNTLIALLAYIALLPNSSWGERYKFFHGLYFTETLVFGFVVLIAVWIMGEMLIGRRPANRPFSGLDWLLSVFFAIVFFSALHGAFQNGNFHIIRQELPFLSFYMFYFLYTRWLSEDEIKTLWVALLFLTFLVSVQYIMLAMSEGVLANLLVNRVSTQQPHLAQIALPLAFSAFLFPVRVKYRAVALLLLFPMLPMIFFSQQRGLWIGIMFSVFLIWSMAFFKEQISFRRILKFILVMLTALLVVAILILLLDRYTSGSVLLTVISRFGSLANLTLDESLRIRMSEVYRALSDWQANSVYVLFGTGLGDMYQSIDAARVNTFAVDNSFVFILWKTGILGLAVFVASIAVVYKKGFYVFVHAKSFFEKQIASALLSGFGGVLLIALTNSCLVLYRFIIVWALVFATIEMLHLRTKNHDSVSALSTTL